MRIGCDANGWTGVLPKPAAKQARRLSRSDRRHDTSAWEELGRQQYSIRLDQDVRDGLESAARYLLRLARALSIDPAAIESTPPSDVRTLLNWLMEFPVSQHGTPLARSF